VNAGIINTPALNVADSIKSPLIVTSHIQVMPGDTAFFIGDAPQYWFSLPPSLFAGNIAGYFGTFSTGIGLGNQFTGSAFESNAVGTGLTVSSRLSVGIGFAFTNNIDNTIMLGWQKPILTVVGGGNGKVGIGLTNPSTAFEVNGNITVDADQTNTWTQSHWKTPIIIDNGSAIRTAAPGGFIQKYLGFGMTDDAGAAGWYWMVQGTTDNSETASYPMSLTYDNTYTYPDNPLLDVAGTIRAHEVKVCVSGCDFVFDKHYKLMPMDKLEVYLKLHHHLPGIASAKEMQSNDVSLGQMASQLLQKDEEQTLYILQLNKELKQQGDEINQLQKEMSELKDDKGK